MPPASMRRLRAWSTAQGYGADLRSRHSIGAYAPSVTELAPLPAQPAAVPWPTTDWPVGAVEVADPGRLDALVDRWRMAHYLSRLPGEERLLLQMRFYQELSQTEIADRTGVPLGTVKSRMVSGLNRLRELLEHEEGALA